MARVLSKRSEAAVPAWERGMNPEQLEAIRHGEGPCRLLAAAGSGKTRVVVHRIARLVAEGVDPDRIVAVTFSKKAADEMNHRIDALGVRGARVGTWHSLCLQILREDRTEWSGWTIDDRDRARYILKEVLGWKGMNWVGADATAVRNFIGRCKANLFAPESPEALELAKKTFGFSAPRAIDAFTRHSLAMYEKMLLTFDDFLVFAAEHLADENVRATWAGRWDYVIQDEAQDANHAQCHIASLLAKDHKNYMVVGDVFQCHPAGTMVEVERGHSVPIEKLRDGDCVRSWNRNAQKMIGGRKVQVASRPYTGLIYQLTASERTVEMTPNHRLLARWTDRGTEACVTYLMWRADLGFRVGWCKMFATTGKGGTIRIFHFAARCRIEKAEKAWILGVHESRTDASVEESIIATAYGIPTATFEPVHGAQHLSGESIRRIFAGAPDLENRGRHLLDDRKLHFDFPLYPWPGYGREEVSRIGRMTYFEVYACNVLPGLMSIPLPEAKNAWTPVDSLEASPYSGKVYSLDVAEDHSYSANGLIVLNSIYGFRGSSPSYLANFERDWEGAKTIWLGRNYRSGRAIIRAANGIVMKAKVDGYEPKEMIGERDFDGKATAVSGDTLEDEAQNFVGWVQRLTGFVGGGDRPKARAEHPTALDVDGAAALSDMTALFRTNAQSRALEEALLKERIPYVVVGGVSFYERKEVRDLLGYLRVAAGTGSADDIKRCINAPFRYLGAKFVEKLTDAASALTDISWPALVEEVAEGDRIQRRQKDSAHEWASTIRHSERRIRAAKDAAPESPERVDGHPARILQDIVKATKYVEWLKKEEGEESIEQSGAANVHEMIRVAEKFPTVEALLDYIDETIRKARRQREDKQAGGERVLLMSVHRSKGLEWPHVWVAGFNEMILPHIKGDPEEERRLAYVAVTRARDSVVLSYVNQLATRAGLKEATPSRFLADSGVERDLPRSSTRVDADGIVGLVRALVDAGLTVENPAPSGAEPTT